MKAILSLLFLLISSSYASECLKLKDENICMKIEWTEGPTLGEYSANIVKFIDMDASSDEVEVYKESAYPVEFYGWMIMGHHEHGTRPVETVVLRSGVHQNTKVFFMGGMKGKWQFNAKINGQVYTLFEKHY